VLEGVAQQVRPSQATIVRPQDAADQLTAKPRTAAFIRDRESPTTDTIVAAFQEGLRNASRADNNNSAVLAAMRSDASSMRIRGKNCPPKRMLVILKRREGLRFARARKSKARDNGMIVESKVCFVQAARGRREHGGKTFVEAQAAVRRPGHTLTESFAREVAQSRAALSATAINTKKKKVSVHLEALMLMLI
jgi:hypothetical protein